MTASRPCLQQTSGPLAVGHRFMVPTCARCARLVPIPQACVTHDVRRIFLPWKNRVLYDDLSVRVTDVATWGNY
jgi:hypothetical protein